MSNETDALIAQQTRTIQIMTDKLRKAEQDVEVAKETIRLLTERADNLKGHLESTLAAYDGLTPADVKALVESHEEVVRQRDEAFKVNADNARDAEEVTRDVIARMEADRIQIEEATARADAAEKQVMELREKATSALRLCRGCDGSGMRTVHCTMCHDSTWDHECNDHEVPCGIAQCIDMRTALSSTDDVAKRWVSVEDAANALAAANARWEKAARQADEAVSKAKAQHVEIVALRKGMAQVESLTFAAQRERDEAVRQRDGYADAMSRLRFALSVGGESRGAKDDEAAITQGIEMLTTPLMRARDEVGIQLAAAQERLRLVESALAPLLRLFRSIAWRPKNPETGESASALRVINGEDIDQHTDDIVKALKDLKAVPGDVLAGTMNGTPVYVDQTLPDGYVRRDGPYTDEGSNGFVERAGKGQVKPTIQTSGVAGVGLHELDDDGTPAKIVAQSWKLGDDPVEGSRCVQKNGWAWVFREGAWVPYDQFACLTEMVQRWCDDAHVDLMAKVKATVAPDAGCINLPNGDCVGEGCMHDPTTWAPRGTPFDEAATVNPDKKDTP